ncbi:tetratricopeptide repeat protein [Micromonospora harpali]|uniref:Tetratricopeptide repeat protein n=1 Tax=Micromonospora harpali TaxID=1490225 RepID=A0ABW1HGK5_9ACTN
MYDRLGDWQQALEFSSQALLITRQIGDRAGEAAIINNIGSVCAGLGNRQQALEFFTQALLITREIGDQAGEATALNNIGGMHRGRWALDYYHLALTIVREVADHAGEATTRHNIARIHWEVGDLDQAIQELEHVVDLRRKVDHPELEADVAVLEQLRRQRAENQRST